MRSPEERSAARRTQRGGRILRAGASCALVGVLAAVSACAPAHEEGHTVIRIADGFSATHPIGKNGAQNFVETLEQKGPEVGLDIEYFANGQLGKPRDLPAVLRTGIAQISVVTPSHVGAHLPLSNVGDLPGFTNDACVGGDAMLEVMQPGTTLYESELAPRDIRPLWIAFLPGYEAMSGSFPIDSPEVLDGKVLRSTGGALDRVVEESGAAGVAMPLQDMYEAISRGTVEGTFASPLSVTPYRLEEVIGYATEGAQLGSVAVTYSVSNEVWSDLNEDQREVISDAARVAQEEVCAGLNSSMEESLAAMREAGTQFHVVTEEERPQWQKVAEPVREKWVADLESVGLPARAVLDEFTQALARAEAKHGGPDHD